MGGTLLLLHDLSRQLGLGSVDDTLALRLAYTWSHFVFVHDAQFGNNDLPGAPQHFLRSELRYDHPVGFWIAPAVESVPAGYAVNSDNTAQTDSYTLCNTMSGLFYCLLSIVRITRNCPTMVVSSLSGISKRTSIRV